MTNDEIIKKRLYNNMKLYKKFHTLIRKVDFEDGEVYKDYLFNTDIFPDSMKMYKKLEKEINEDIQRYLKIYTYPKQ